MNEKAKCNKLKGSEFKNKQKILLFKNLERQSFQMTIKIISKLIKAPGLHSVVSVGMSTRNAWLNSYHSSLPIPAINYKTTAMTLT